VSREEQGDNEKTKQTDCRVLRSGTSSITGCLGSHSFSGLFRPLSEREESVFPRRSISAPVDREILGACFRKELSPSCKGSFLLEGNFRLWHIAQTIASHHVFVVYNSSRKPSRIGRLESPPLDGYYPQIRKSLSRTATYRQVEILPCTTRMRPGQATHSGIASAGIPAYPVPSIKDA
jgi:hypothetical protein